MKSKRRSQPATGDTNAPISEDRRATVQARFTGECKRLVLHDDELEQMGLPCLVCDLGHWSEEDLEKWAGASDLAIVELLVKFYRLYIDDVIVVGFQLEIDKLTRERDKARRDCEHAQSQLKTIGRKAFWAAKETE